MDMQLQRLKTGWLVNLAAQEYFKSIDAGNLEAEVITPVFWDSSKGQYRTICVYAKKARGQLSRFVIRNRLKDLRKIKDFNAGGCQYDRELSPPAESGCLRATAFRANPLVGLAQKPEVI